MEIAITGCSVALDGFDDACDLREALAFGSDAKEPAIVARNGSRVPGSALGVALDGFPVKLRNQCDPSTMLGMKCLSALYAGSGLKGSLATDRIGVFCTTTLGGVEFSEPQLFAQTFVGPHRVSAYQAIAWFYAAAQGQWTIAEGVNGHAKSFVGDRVGAIQAILGAAMALEAGHCDAALCATYESPATPFSLALLESGGRTSRNGESRLTQGAAALCLEAPERALARKVATIGFVVGADTRPAGDSPGDALARCVASVLEQAQSGGVAIVSAVLGDVPAKMFADIQGSLTDPVPDISCGGSSFGDPLSVGCYLDLVSACLGLLFTRGEASSRNAREGFLLVAADEAAVGCLAIRWATESDHC